MTYLLLSLLAFTGGAAIAAQAAMNAQLGVMLGNTLLATLVAFVAGLLFSVINIVLFSKELPSMQTAGQVPYYLWFSGGILSAFAITAFYWLIPKMGVAALISTALTGQLLFSLLAGHFAWFNFPMTPFTVWKLMGSLCLLLGMVLINK